MTAGTPKRLIVCSKSTWEPAIRREHALARLAAGAGIAVTFVERPLDVRALRDAASRRRWSAGLQRRPAPQEVAPGLQVLPASVVVPGHRGAFAERTAAALLRARLRSLPGLDAATVVAAVPWQWPAVARAPAARRVFDCAEDWGRQIPGRRKRIEVLYDRIDAEADAVILANPDMAARFPAARTIVVRNGVADELMSELTRPPRARRMVWAGTLSERFDAPLAGAVLELASDWTLDLFGQCQYAGCGEAPGRELAELLRRYPDRVRLHGVVPRPELAEAIDSGRVAVIFNRRALTHGPDSMKLYDYAARGRAVIATRFANTIAGDAPPHLKLADTAEEIVAALRDTLYEPPEWALQRRRWAEGQRWERRWPEFSAALIDA